MIFCLYIFARVSERDLDLVSTFSIQSLASSKDVTAAMMLSLLLEIKVFYCLFYAAFKPKLVWLYFELLLSFCLDLLLFL